MSAFILYARHQLNSFHVHYISKVKGSYLFIFESLQIFLHY